MRIHYYETRSGRRPAKDFIDELPTRQRAQVLADLEAVERYGLLAPVSRRAIRGRDNKGMYEFRIGPHRIYYTTLVAETMVLLGGSKKDDQDREIRACAQRMKELRERAK